MTDPPARRRLPSLPREDAPPDDTLQDPTPWGRGRPAARSPKGRRSDAPTGGGASRLSGAGPVVIVAVAAVLGLAFAAISTRDFTAHLDRQVHGVSCSFLPGVGTPDVSGASGCHATLMSPWSSFLRDRIWGGIPIAALAMAVFAFVLFAALALVVTRRARDPRATAALLALAGVPVAASLVWGGIAAFELSALCKVCVGIYVASALVAIGAWLAFRGARRAPAPAPVVPWPSLVVWAALLGVFVATPVAAYALWAPSHAQYVGACGTLAARAPADDLTVPLSVGEGPRTLEVLDPLCPACRAFESRLLATDVGSGLARSALLFPLDDRCNWMVSEAVHPGACVVSEALLCAGASAPEVLDWAFAEQEALLALGRSQPNAVAQRVLAAFPDLRGCLGSAKARARLNRGLRWAVEMELPVLTPQLYVGGLRLCDEDTDLGLDYALPRLVRSAERIPLEARTSAEGVTR